MEISENDALDICNKFFKEREIDIVEYQNFSKIGLNPVLIKRRDNVKINLYDSYKSILDVIMPEIKKDLEENGGWTDSFYLTLEDIDILGLHEFFESELVKRDLESYVEDVSTMKI